MPPQGSFAPTSQWKAGSSLVDKHGLILPADLAAGDYTLQIGLYRSDDQAPVKVTRGDQLMPEAIGVIVTTVKVP